MEILYTERLILRSWTINDLDDFYEYARNPNIGPNAGWEPHSSKEISLKIINSFMEKDEVWAIALKDTKKVIGSIGLHNDSKRQDVNAKMLGYVLSEDYWGKGLIVEASMRVLKYAFDELNLDLVSIYHYPFNSQSKRVIEKCGFTYEGTIRCASEIYNGNIYDEVCYSILKGEYYAKYA